MGNYSSIQLWWANWVILGNTEAYRGILRELHAVIHSSASLILPDNWLVLHAKIHVVYGFLEKSTEQKKESLWSDTIVSATAQNSYTYIEYNKKKILEVIFLTNAETPWLLVKICPAVWHSETQSLTTVTALATFLLNSTTIPCHSWYISQVMNM